ncbi:MAG TPA: YbhB/YbcL family Raf kinase inhibitor-like protein [Polyangiales bacterium]
MRGRSLPWLLLGCMLAAPQAAGAERPKQELTSLTLGSSAFAAQREIPSKYTCEGADVSPPLSWDGVPEDAQSLVLIVEDPDAPDPAAPRRTWVHWIVLDLPPTTRGLREDARELPPGALDGLNDSQRTGYSGPCPPRGRHRYFFRLYALDTKLSLIKPQRAQLEAALQGHVIARAELMGTYEKKKRPQPEVLRQRGHSQP